MMEGNSSGDYKKLPLALDGRNYCSPRTINNLGIFLAIFSNKGAYGCNCTDD